MQQKTNQIRTKQNRKNLQIPGLKLIVNKLFIIAYFCARRVHKYILHKLIYIARRIHLKKYFPHVLSETEQARFTRISSRTNLRAYKLNFLLFLQVLFLILFS